MAVGQCFFLLPFISLWHLKLLNKSPDSWYILDNHTLLAILYHSASGTDSSSYTNLWSIDLPQTFILGPLASHFAHPSKSWADSRSLSSWIPSPYHLLDTAHDVSQTRHIQNWIHLPFKIQTPLPPLFFAFLSCYVMGYPGLTIWSM